MFCFDWEKKFGHAEIKKYVNAHEVKIVFLILQSIIRTVDFTIDTIFFEKAKQFGITILAEVREFVMIKV